MIELVNVNKEIKGKLVLENMSCKFERGKSYLLTGHNGSGKTMLLRAICGLIKPSNGLVNYGHEYRFGVVIEQPSFIEGYTGMKNMEMLAAINKSISKPTIIDTLKKLEMEQHKDKKVKTYSLGMKQKLGICQAVMEDQDVVLLDEPFNALDENSHKVVCNLLTELKQRNKIVVVAAHGLSDNTKKIFDEHIHLNNGMIA